MRCREEGAVWRGIDRRRNTGGEERIPPLLVSGERYAPAMSLRFYDLIGGVPSASLLFLCCFFVGERRRRGCRSLCDDQ